MKDYIEIDSNLQIYYESNGTGTAIICVPGWAYSLDIFEHNIDALSKDYRVISFDPRSHGNSSVTEKGNTYLQQGRDLHRLLSFLEIKECVLLGWSLGVYAIYSYLQEYGFGGVRAIIAVDESPKIIKQSEQDWGEGVQEEIDGLIGLVDSDAYLGFFRDYMAGGFIEKPSDELLDRFTQKASSLSPKMAAQLLTDSTKYNFEQLARDAAQNIPFLNIVRESWAENALRWIEKNQPTSKVLVLGEHLMLHEFAEEFSKSVINFLANSLSK